MVMTLASIEIEAAKITPRLLTVGTNISKGELRIGFPNQSPYNLDTEPPSSRDLISVGSAVIILGGHSSIDNSRVSSAY